MVGPTTGSGSARQRVAEALRTAAHRFPDLPPTTLDVAALDRRDARLALAIHRTVLQRWITLEYLLDRHLRQPMHQLEPALRAVLLSAAAQLLFMDRLPTHAVVNESVNLAGRMVRPGAAGLVNAVLRRLAEQVVQAAHDQPWVAARDRLPLDDGCVVLRDPCLPDPGNFVEHLAVATSHRAELVKQWSQTFGPDTTTTICRHGVVCPPTIVAVEPDFHAQASEDWHSHAQPGFIVWQGPHDRLAAFCQSPPVRRVQDPASAEPVQATGHLSPGCVIDYCGGRGTKTRQLAALHPDARIVATDTDRNRLCDLRAACAACPNVTVVEPEKMAGALVDRPVDLLVLDVPCSNTAVLARRPEARYRFSAATIESLAELQRAIIEQTIHLLHPGGHLLYSTCSLEPAENHEQVEWIRRQFAAQLVHQSLTTPSGTGTSYHDGSYHALLRMN